MLQEPQEAKCEGQILSEGEKKATGTLVKAISTSGDINNLWIFVQGKALSITLM